MGQLAEIRAKYRMERDRRIRPEGAAQYRRAAGEFGYYATDPYTPRSSRPPVRDRVEVLIVGAGFGGLLSGARLRQAGFQDVRVVDEAGDFGGTWYWNRYPGIHCDIESSVYMPLLEEIGYVPAWRYAPGEEIRQHAMAVARHFDLYRDTMFQTRVTELRWDDTTDEWIVRTDRGDEMRARYVIVSSGTLTQPKLPGIPGIETFAGHTFHTSRWDYDYTGGDQNGGLHKLAGKRVGIVGTGATGVQVIPHLGRDAGHLYVFQRTPSSVDARGNRPTGPEWAGSRRPGWQRERMDNFLTLVSGGRADRDLIQDGWTSTARLQRQFLGGEIDPSGSPAADELADLAKMNEIRARVDEIVTDPATAELLKPWYRYMCKRPTFSDFYLPTFNRPNVTLVDTADHGGITAMTEKAVVVGDRSYEADCLIFATGFEVAVSGVLSGTLPVHGRDGRTLLEAWAQGPRTLHGFYSHGFPNLIHLASYQAASSVNMVHMLQEKATHIAAVLAVARARGVRRVEPTAAAEQAWAAEIEATAHDTYEFTKECTPGYYNGEGRPRRQTFSYGPGPLAFHQLLGEWRAGTMDDVLGPTGSRRPV